MSLKSKLVNLKNKLVLKISELERLKLKAISKPVDLLGCLAIVGENNEKNTSNSSNIFMPSIPNKNLSKYFVYNKNMDQVEKIDTNTSSHTDNKSNPISELSKDDTEINSKISDETSISKISKDILPI